MAIGCATGLFYHDKPWKETFEFSCVKQNPIYWLLWLCVVPCLLSGKWFHACLGQGSKVRPDELAHEEVPNRYATDP